ncbi:MAG: methylmalonyl-CoA epimerase [candidate division GAL15 bacterium]
MTVRGIHHIGVVVKDAEAAARRLEEALGVRVVHWEDYGPGLLRIGFVPVGGTLIELIEPLGDETNARWLEEHGEGVQHIALEVEDVGAAIEELTRRGVAMRDAVPRAGAGNTLIAFLQGTMAGMWLELTQPLGEAPWRGLR